MDIKLEKRECVEDWTGQINDKEIFYRYNINGNLVWFSQMRDSGNIYSVSVRLNDYLDDYFNVWVCCDDNKLFYPNDITIEMRHSNIKQEEVSRVVSDINYVNRLCDMIMSIFKTKEHYALWYKHHKDNEHSKHKDHHCVCCGEYIEEEHLKVCDKCASEFKF